MPVHIRDEDLRVNQYSIEELEANLDDLNLRIVLNTQRLTADFCMRHMLLIEPEDYGWEDWYFFDTRRVLDRQKHLTEADLTRAWYENKERERMGEEDVRIDA